MTVEVLPLKPGALQCCGPGRIFQGIFPAMASESDTESLRREDLHATRWSLADVLRNQRFFAPRLPVWREFLRWPRQLWCPGLPVSRSGISCCRTSENPSLPAAEKVTRGAFEMPRIVGCSPRGVERFHANHGHCQPPRRLPQFQPCCAWLSATWTGWPMTCSARRLSLRIARVCLILG